MYTLTETEGRRLVEGIRAAYAIPFIHDVTDFVWEAIFSYTKGIPITDPLTTIRSKLLYDVTDRTSGVGWSLKALQTPIRLHSYFELVIQRADIFKKGVNLGFGSLSPDSPPQILGKALLKHWYEKVERDAIIQNINEKRISILLKI